MMLTNRMLCSLAAVGLTVVIGPIASADITVWNQGFESDTAGWSDNDSGWAGEITRVEAPDGGISASSGTHFARLIQGVNSANTGDDVPTGPFSPFDAYRSVWPGGYTATIDVYLDTAWTAGEGFDYSVAANGSDGLHEQDFVFHATKDTSTGKLLVAANSNTNTDHTPAEYLEDKSPYEVITSAWYTLEHVFFDDGDGTVSVEMNLRDSLGTVLYTRTMPITDGGVEVTLPDLGGNRYGWFTGINVDGGLAIDNHTLSTVPEPASLALLGLGGGAMLLRRRRRAC